MLSRPALNAYFLSTLQISHMLRLFLGYCGLFVALSCLIYHVNENPGSPGSPVSCLHIIIISPLNVSAVTPAINA